MDFIKVKDIDFADAYIQIFDLLDDGIMVVDMEGKLVVYNRSSEELDKLKREDVIGKHIQECFKTSNYSSVTLKTLETKKASINVYQSYVTVDGKLISSVSSSYPLMRGSKMLGVFTLTKDITKFKETLDVFYKHDIKEAEKDDGRAKFTFDQIIGKSEELKKSINISEIASKTSSNMLIYGETGTGKELFAQSIHNNSSVRGPFVSINCAAIPENLLEGLLFGTTKGAFTGARDHPGLFEEAKDGTLFLDELNSMTLNLQSKLLRAIETGKIRRVGETKERVVKPRIVSALNIHPLDAIKDGILRRDLFYRLGIVTVVIPPLRERLEDIPMLVEEFVNKFNNKFDKRIKGITKEVEELFKIHDWPGNVRELEHSIEHSMIITDEKDFIQRSNLPVFLTEIEDNTSSEQLIIENVQEELEKQDLTSLMERMEEQIIREKVLETNGNIAEASRRLGVSRQNLEYRIKKYDI
nr:sigma 54-interacting transcriptional regulator [Tissierella sp.]